MCFNERMFIQNGFLMPIAEPVNCITQKQILSCKKVKEKNCSIKVERSS